MLLLMASCKNAIVSEREVQAVQAVLDFYGGVCNRHKGFKKEKGKEEVYFGLEMSESKLIESYSDMLGMPASNIAYLFYTNLKEEKEKYTHIKVKINLTGGHSQEFYYSTQDLKEVETLTPVLQTVSEIIKTKDFNALYSLIDQSFAAEVSADQLKSYCTPFDSAYGQIRTTQFQGFSFFHDKDSNREQALLNGIMLRTGKNTPISVVVDRQNKKVFGIRFELYR